MDNEKRLEGIGDRMDKIKDLADEIDSTKNIKESQDLTNRLLVEILLTLNEQLLTATNFYEAQAMMLYSGEQSDEKFKEEQEAMQKAEKEKKGSKHEQWSREMQSDTRSAQERNKDESNNLLLLMKKEQAKNKK
jgi:basic membrane lipoprotein Med (substrate-binding protein (PBP1-ABC) superfamily)